MIIPAIIGLCSIICYHKSVSALDCSLAGSYKQMQTWAPKAKFLSEASFGLGVIPLWWGLPGIAISLVVLAFAVIRRLT